jgi:UPF0176 protein
MSQRRIRRRKNDIIASDSIEGIATPERHMKYTIILFYKYVHIENPIGFMREQKKLAGSLGLTGRMIIAEEGVNGTFEGECEKVDEYIKDLLSRPGFEDIHIKRSEGTGSAFPKLSIKVRPEIVATHLPKEEDVDPRVTTGRYLTPEELHEWIQSGKKFYIIDMRNDYEQEVGHFKGSIMSGMKNFYDLPAILPSLAHLQDEPIVTVCTGGVRCEKASGFLVKNGFKDVHQLYGGIVSYMEKYPGEDFLGSLYVFDNRLVMSFNMDDPKREIIGTCANCGKKSENFINCTDHFCHRHFIACKACLRGAESMLCPMGCVDYSEKLKTQGYAV